MRGGSPHPPRKTGANPDGMRRENTLVTDRSKVYTYDGLNRLAGANPVIWCVQSDDTE